VPLISPSQFSISGLLEEKEKYMKHNLKECRTFVLRTFIAHSLLSMELDCEFKLLFLDYVLYFIPDNLISPDRLKL